MASLPYTPQGDSPQGAAIRISSVTLLIVGGSFVSLRMLSRVFVVRKIGVDDLSILLALGTSTAMTILAYHLTNSGVGQHTWQLNGPLLESSQHLFWALLIIYNISIVLTKLALILSYRSQLPPLFVGRVKNLKAMIEATDFNHKRSHMMIAVFVTLVVCFGVATTVNTVFICLPIELLWKEGGSPSDGSCANKAGVWYANTGMDVVLNLSLTVFALPMLQHVVFSRFERFAMVIAIIVGLFITAASCMRLYYVSLFAASDDTSFTLPPYILWTLIETNASLTLVSLPAIAPLISLLLPSRHYSSPQRSRENSGPFDSDDGKTASSPGRSDLHRYREASSSTHKDHEPEFSDDFTGNGPSGREGILRSIDQLLARTKRDRNSGGTLDDVPRLEVEIQRHVEITTEERNASSSASNREQFDFGKPTSSSWRVERQPEEPLSPGTQPPQGSTFALHNAAESPFLICSNTPPSQSEALESLPPRPPEAHHADKIRSRLPRGFFAHSRSETQHQPVLQDTATTPTRTRPTTPTSQPYSRPRTPANQPPQPSQPPAAAHTPSRSGPSIQTSTRVRIRPTPGVRNAQGAQPRRDVLYVRVGAQPRRSSEPEAPQSPAEQEEPPADYDTDDEAFAQLAGARSVRGRLSAYNSGYNSAQGSRRPSTVDNGSGRGGPSALGSAYVSAQASRRPSAQGDWV